MKSISKMTKALLGGGIIPLLVSFLYLTFVPSALAVTLEPGDLIVADVNGAFGGYGGSSPSGSGRIIKVDPDTGAQTIISSGNLLDAPWGVAIDANGNIIVVDKAYPGGGGTGISGQIIEVNPYNGDQTVISEDGLFVNPGGVAIDANGNIIVADQLYDTTGDDTIGGIIKVDPTTGAQTVVASGGYINGPSDITIDAAGNIYVPSSIVGGVVSIVRVDPTTGTQELISSGSLSAWYSGIVIDDTTGNIFVSEIYSYNGIFKVDPDTGAQTILSSGYPFQDPWDLDIDLAGNLVAADGNWWGEGRIIKVNPADPAVKTVISSSGLLVDPSGIAVFPPPEIVNNPPAADAGPDQTVILGETVIFDGSDSYDPDGEIVSYDWDFGDGDTDSGETTTHVYASPWIYTVTLTVMDDDEATDTDTAIVTVQTSVEATQDLISDIEELNLPKGTENSLVSKLEAAINSLDKGQENAAINKLNAFINQVEAQRGKKITDEEADALIAEAERIIDSI